MAPQWRSVLTGKAPTGGQLLGGAQALGSPQSLAIKTSAQEPGQDPDMSTPVDEGLPLEPSDEVRAPAASAGAADALQDPARSLHRFRVLLPNLASSSDSH